MEVIVSFGGDDDANGLKLIVVISVQLKYSEDH